MKATGMIRRIDELGRVVIPKEIRRSMRIKEGEELEIFAEDEGLVLKKYSALSDLAEGAGHFAKVLAKETGGVVYVVDRDKVVATTAKSGETALPPPLEEALASRRKGVIRSDFFPDGEGYVEPIVVGGDLMGGIVLAKKGVDQGDIDKARLVRRLMESQLARD